MGLEVLYLLIPVTFILAVLALGMFVWAIHAGQFDDLETPAMRILFDDSLPAPPKAEAGATAVETTQAGPARPGLDHFPGKRPA